MNNQPATFILQGLSDHEVRKRLAVDGHHELPAAKKRAFFHIPLEGVREPKVMESTKRTTLFILAVISVFGAAWLIRQRRAGTAGLSHWQRTLSRRYGAKKARQLAAAVHRQHASLVDETRMPENAALRWHLTEKILPGLALYRALLQEHAGDQAAALAGADEAFRAKTLAKSRLLFAPLKVLPNPFRIFRWILPQTMKQFPPAGWDITTIEDSADRIAFNMTSCFYMNTLTALGAPELTASFCKSDDDMAECFPPGIRYVRQHTLGRGDAVCDFQYFRGRQP